MARARGVDYINGQVNLYHSLAAEASVLEAKHFARFHPGLFLFGRFPGAGAGSGDQPRAFQTQVVPIVGTPAPVPATQRFVCAIEKAKGSVWSSRISVGRAGNSDIVLSHPSISKLHAHFYWRNPDRPDHGLLITDVGSQNGTWLNDWRLELDEQVDVSPGDKLRFGQVEAEVIDARRLHPLLIDDALSGSSESPQSAGR